MYTAGTHEGEQKQHFRKYSLPSCWTSNISQNYNASNLCTKPVIYENAVAQWLELRTLSLEIPASNPLVVVLNLG